MIALLAGCVRLGRVLVPEEFVAPAAPTGVLATVEVASGWRGEPASPYAPERAADPAWTLPVEVTDRGVVVVTPRRPDAVLAVYVRHDDLVPHDFRPVLATTAPLRGRLPTALWPLPGGALGEAPAAVRFADLGSAWSPEPVVDGDLVWLRVTAPGAPAEDYLFRAHAFGVRLQPGAGVWVPVALPGVRPQAGLHASPALVATFALNQRWRTRAPAARFLGEQLGVVGAVGIGSTALERAADAPLDAPRTAFDAALLGGGLRLFQLVDLAILVNASGAFREGPREAPWTAAVGVDAVRAAFVGGKAAVRLFGPEGRPPATEDPP